MTTVSMAEMMVLLLVAPRAGIAGPGAFPGWFVQPVTTVTVTGVGLVMTS